MHYANGTEAKEGDFVVARTSNRRSKDEVVAGVIHTLAPEAETCNGRVAVVEFGRVESVYVTVANCVRADEAIASYVPDLGE